VWIVENTLRATLTFRGLDVSIAPGEQFDLDVLGRRRAERSSQVQVAFEEGYLANVHKAPAVDGDATAGPLPAVDGGLDQETVGPEGPEPSPRARERLEAFRREVLAELRASLPELGSRRDAAEHDVPSLVGELKLIRERFLSFSERVQLDSSLDPDEVEARLALLAEEERQLLDTYGVAGPEEA